MKAVTVARPAAHQGASLRMAAGSVSSERRSESLRIRQVTPALEQSQSVPKGPTESKQARQDCYCPEASLSEEQRSTLLILQRLFGSSGRIYIPQQTQTQSPSLPNAGSGQAAPAGPSWGMTYSAQIERYEMTRFAAEITFADGSSSQLQLSYQRYEQESLTLRAGADAIDPLALDLGGGGLQARRAEQPLQVDLQGDGSLENLPDLGNGGVWLVHDRNGNGLVDDGSELFGPASGNGFRDLAALDVDHNGWVDADDPAWSSLALWRQDGSLIDLEAADLSALSTASLDGAFTLRDQHDQDLAQLRRTGVYLKTDRQLGAIQQLDIIV